MIPWIFGPEHIQQTQLTMSILGAGIFAFIGVFILGLWVPYYHLMPDKTREHIREAYLLFAIALLCLIFGMYFFAVAAIVLAIVVVLILLKSISIMRGKENSTSK